MLEKLKPTLGVALLASIISLLPNAAMAADALNGADTVWLLISTALVMIMIPGLALFYCGMVHSTNVVATMMHSYMKLCLIMVIWILWGYSLAFSESSSGIIGGLEFLWFENVTSAPAEGSVIPHNLFAIFQGLFAAITAAIITGAFAERVRLTPVLIFSILWITIVYAPIAHWIWGGGWLHQEFGALDFAGGAVVHINAGVAGLVAALVLGKRVKDQKSQKPHNLPLTILGAALLWFGWYGFNGGSALAADGIASLAVVNTTAAAAAGALGWFFIESFYSKDTNVTALGIISGSIAGLVAITPAAGFVTAPMALLIGLIGGIVCYYAVIIIKPKLGYDDSLDAFGIHGVGGLWGAIATGLFATLSVNPDGANGLFYGSADLLWAEIVTSAVVIAYSAVATYLILKFLQLFMRIRVSEEEERKGLDKTQHGEVGYEIEGEI